MTAELARRGAGHRESGAFLLGAAGRDRPTVSHVIYFDDLDPHCLTGAIHIDGSAFTALWDICDAHHLNLIGDIHTHPGDSVRQSLIDQHNPMLARSGHVALIAPNYARGRPRPDNVGVHVYRGQAGWETFIGLAAAQHLYVGWRP